MFPVECYWRKGDGLRYRSQARTGSHNRSGLNGFVAVDSKVHLRCATMETCWNFWGLSNTSVKTAIDVTGILFPNISAVQNIQVPSFKWRERKEVFLDSKKELFITSHRLWSTKCKRVDIFLTDSWRLRRERKSQYKWGCTNWHLICTKNQILVPVGLFCIIPANKGSEWGAIKTRIALAAKRIVYTHRFV